MVSRSYAEGVPGSGRSLASATGLLALAMVAGKPITFARDVLVARQFGATGAVDFVILAQLLPLLLVGAVSNGVVLCLPALFRGTPDGAQGVHLMRIFSTRVLQFEAALLLGAGLVASVVFTIWLPRGAPFPPAIIALVCTQALLDSAVALRAQARQVQGNFGRPAFQYAANGVVTIVVVLLLGSRLGIWAWPIGLLADAAWQLAFLGLRGTATRDEVERDDLPSRWILRLAVPSVALFALTMVYAVTDRIVAVGIATGFLALWTWAQRVGAAISGAASLPLASALLSRGHVAGRREPQYYGAALAVAVGVSSLAAVAFVFVGARFTSAVFGSSALRDAQLGQLKSLIGLVLIAGIFTSIFSVASRAFIAQGNFRPPTICFGVSALSYPACVAALLAAGAANALAVSYVLASAIAGISVAILGVRAGLICLVPSGRAVRG